MHSYLLRGPDKRWRTAAGPKVASKRIPLSARALVQCPCTEVRPISSLSPRYPDRCVTSRPAIMPLGRHAFAARLSTHFVNWDSAEFYSSIIVLIVGSPDSGKVGSRLAGSADCTVSRLSTNSGVLLVSLHLPFYRASPFFTGSIFLSSGAATALPPFNKRK